MTAADYFDKARRSLNIFREHGTPFPPHLIAEGAGGEVLAVVYPPAQDMDLALKAAVILAPAFRPAAFVLVADTYVRRADSRAEAEAVVAAMGPRSFQHAVERGERGDIRDALMIVRVPAAGDPDYYSRTYQTFEDSPVYWDDDPPGPGTLDGRVVHSLTRALTETLPVVAAAQAAIDARFPDIPEDCRARLRRQGGADALRLLGFTVILPEDAR